MEQTPTDIEPDDATHDDPPVELLELHQILEVQRIQAEGPESVALEGYATNE